MKTKNKTNKQTNMTAFPGEWTGTALKPRKRKAGAGSDQET